MDNRDLCQSSLEMAFTLCSTFYQMADNVKAKKNNCQQVTKRVKVLEGLILTFKNKEQDGISPTVENELKDLCSNLKSAKTLMKKLSRNNYLSGFQDSGKYDNQFDDLDERLSHNFQVLSGALRIDHGNDPSSMRPMAYNPTPSMPQPSSMLPMMYDHTAPMSQPSRMPPMMYDHTPSMPQPSSMLPMMYDHTAPMSQPSRMPPMMYDHTPSMPQPSNMLPMTTYSPVTPYPSQSPMPTIAMSNSIRPLSSIPFPNSSMGMMAPMSFSTQTTSAPNYGFVP